MNDKTKIATPDAHSNQSKKDEAYKAIAAYYAAQLSKPTANPSHPIFR